MVHVRLKKFREGSARGLPGLRKDDASGVWRWLRASMNQRRSRRVSSERRVTHGQPSRAQLFQEKQRANRVRHA